MAKIYTRAGDNGNTILIGGEKVSKSDILVDVYGTLDELSAFIGVLYDTIEENSPERVFLMEIQNTILSVEAFYASHQNNKYEIDNDKIIMLENQIDNLPSSLLLFDGFKIPGGNIVTSYCHVCRTICRRAERRIVKIDKSSNCLKYINRLSDYFFELSRTLTL